MTTMRFDADAVQALATRVSLLSDRLRDAGALPELTAEQFGSTELSGRMSSFRHDWSDGMDRIVGELADVSGLLREAAIEYAGSEAAVRDAMGPRRAEP